jgi:hypothetical protein
VSHAEPWDPAAQRRPTTGRQRLERHVRLVSTASLPRCAPTAQKVPANTNKQHTPSPPVISWSSPPRGPRCHPTVCLTQMRYEIASSHRLTVVVHATVHPPHLLPRRPYCSLTRATRTKLREIGADVFVTARQKIVTRCWLLLSIAAPAFQAMTRSLSRMKSTATASEFSPSSIAAPQPLLANHLACQLWQISVDFCGGVLLSCQDGQGRQCGCLML